MPSKGSSYFSNAVKYLFIALTLYYVLLVWKIPMPCTGCENGGGLWYRCIAGTGLGTDTCTYSTTGGIPGIIGTFSTAAWDQLTNIINSITSSSFFKAPSSIVSRIVAIWNSIVNTGSDIVNQIKSIFTYIQGQISVIINDYIIGSINTAASFVRNNIIVPVIQGITNYIINPVKTLIGDLIAFKDQALGVFQQCINTIKGLGVDVYEYTYGLLVEGFDQIPYGLVLFVEGIQKLLNYLKHQVIDFANAGVNVGVDIVNDFVSGVLTFAKDAVKGTQTSVNFLAGIIDDVSSSVINYALNPAVDGLNDVLDFDLGGLGRGAVNMLVGVTNDIANVFIDNVINPLIGVADSVESGFVTAVNTIENVDITGWIPTINLGFTKLKIPSFKPFSWIPNINYVPLTGLPDNPIPMLGTNEIPSYKLAQSIGLIPHVQYKGLPVPDFATPTGKKLDGWIASAHIDENQISEPNDLFWAGTQVMSYGEKDKKGGIKYPNFPTGAPCNVIGNEFRYIGLDGNSYPYGSSPYSSAYDQYGSGTCYFSAMSYVDNHGISQNSCTDVCYQNGNLGTDLADPTNVCQTGNQIFIYGTPAQNAIPSYSLEAGTLQIYLYKNQPMTYFAPNLYRLDSVSVNTTIPSNPVFTNTPTTFTASDTPYLSIVSNGGVKDTRNNKFYILQIGANGKQVNLPTGSQSVKAWSYLTNPHTNSSTSCDVEYMMPSSPESLGISSEVDSYNNTIYRIDNIPYIYLSPKLYQLNNSAPVPVSLTDLTSSTSQYTLPIKYSDNVTNQSVLIQKFYGYALNNDTTTWITLPVHYVNNVAVPLQPSQAGFTTNNLGTLTYYNFTKSGTNYYYDMNTFNMIPFVDSTFGASTTLSITGKPESQTTPYYLSSTYNGVYVYQSGNNPLYVFASYSQRQFLLLLQQNGYQIDVNGAVILQRKMDANCNPIQDPNNTNSWLFNSPADESYILQPTDSNGLTYYRKNGINYLYDNSGNAMVPMVPYDLSNLSKPRTDCNAPTSAPVNTVRPTVSPTQPPPDYDPYPTFSATTPAPKTPSPTTPAPTTAAATPSPTTPAPTATAPPGTYMTGPSPYPPTAKTVFWGTPTSTGYNKELFGYSMNGKYYHFVVGQRMLIEYFSKDRYQTTCKCSNNLISSKTCTDYCAAGKDSTGAQLGCDDTTSLSRTGYICSDPRSLSYFQNTQPNCACTQQGPVNIIVQPMQQYNPFRLIKKGVESAFSELTNVLKYAIQSFLTPVWNTIVGFVQYIGSLIMVVVNFISHYLNPGFILQQLQYFYNLAANGFTQYVWRDGILYVVNYIVQLFNNYLSPSALARVFQPVVNFFSATFLYVVQAFSDAMKVVGQTVWSVLKIVGSKLMYFQLEFVNAVANIGLFWLPLDQMGRTAIVYFILFALLAGNSIDLIGKYTLEGISTLFGFVTRFFSTILEIISPINI